MVNLIALRILISVIFVAAFALQGKSQEKMCLKINPILEFFKVKKDTDTTTSYPLLKRKSISSFPYHGKFVYSSAITLPGETDSEFFIDLGKWNYLAILGLYDKSSIDSAGNVWRGYLLNCIQRSDWSISNIPDSYLVMSYKPIDIFVSVQKNLDKNSGKYKLLFSIMRFTRVR